MKTLELRPRRDIQKAANRNLNIEIQQGVVESSGVDNRLNIAAFFNGLDLS